MYRHGDRRACRELKIAADAIDAMGAMRRRRRPTSCGRCFGTTDLIAIEYPARMTPMSRSRYRGHAADHFAAIRHGAKSTSSSSAYHSHPAPSRSPRQPICATRFEAFTSSSLPVAWSASARLAAERRNFAEVLSSVFLRGWARGAISSGSHSALFLAITATAQSEAQITAESPSPRISRAFTAPPPSPDRHGRSITIASDEEVTEAVVVIGGIGAGRGRVRNNLAWSGQCRSRTAAEVRGDVVVVGGTLTRAPARGYWAVSHFAIGEWAPLHIAVVLPPSILATSAGGSRFLERCFACRCSRFLWPWRWSSRALLSHVLRTLPQRRRRVRSSPVSSLRIWFNSRSGRRRASR